MYAFGKIIVKFYDIIVKPSKEYFYYFSYGLKKYGFEILTDCKSNYLNVYDVYEK